MMNDLSQIERPGTDKGAAERVRAGAYGIFALCSEMREGAEDFFGPGGRCKPLKRLDSDKEIKVNSFDFLWPGVGGHLTRVGYIWILGSAYDGVHSTEHSTASR